MTSNSSLASSSAPSNFQWQRLGGIVAVQSAMTLAWVTYSLYLPDLLVQLGFAKGLAGTLLIVEHFLEVIIEPVFGGLSDRSQNRIGSRLPWISLGVILASAFFIGLPAIATFVPAVSPLRWVFPVMAVLWASAMAIFRSPALSLLRQASPKVELPLAASFLTLVQQLIGALRFTAYGIVLSLGPLATFAIGSMAFLGAAAVLRQVTPPTPSSEAPGEPLPPLPPRTLVTIVGLAIGIALGVRFLFSDLAQIFALQLGKEQANMGMLGFNFILALCAIPVGQLASKLGNTKVMVTGLVGTALLLGGIAATASPVLLGIGLLLMGVSFSAVLNGMVPAVLSLVPEGRSGLGVGSYFGAFGGAISLFTLLFADMTSLPLKAGLGALCFVMAGLFLVFGKLREGGKSDEFPL